MARVLQLTDLHVVAPGKRASGVLDTGALLRTAIDLLLERLPSLAPLDAVVVTGDISDDGSSESYALARTELDRLALPLFVVPGNHDAREPMRAAFADLPQMPRSGPIDWSTELGDTFLVGLDTLVEGKGSGRLCKDSLSRLDKVLSKAGSRPVLLAMHHPPLRTGIAFMDAIGLENASELEEVLVSSPNSGRITVLAGHVHGIYHGRIGASGVATAPSVCSGFAPDIRPDAPVGFFTGPKGCAVIDTGPGGVWSAISLEPADGPFPFNPVSD